jgi:hypothetical protein
MELFAVASSAVAIASGICAIILFFIGRKKTHHDDGVADASMKYDVKYIREKTDDMRLDIKEMSRKQDSTNETLVRHDMRLTTLEAKVENLERNEKE